MLTRRIAASACTLCLAIAASAGASPATSPPEAKGPFGLPPAGPPSTVKAKGPFGLPPAGPPSTVKAIGPFGNAPCAPECPARHPTSAPAGTVKARGPYGIAPGRGPYRPQNTTAASVHRGGASRRDGANGWRTAAISEAALLAVVALGWALLLPARRRVPRVVT
jgi:hypothetical protein